MSFSEVFAAGMGVNELNPTLNLVLLWARTFTLNILKCLRRSPALFSLSKEAGNFGYSILKHKLFSNSDLRKAYDGKNIKASRILWTMPTECKTNYSF